MIDEEVREGIKKAAIKNAISYGKARSATVTGSVLSLFPELKANLKELSAEVEKEVSRVNKLNKAELEKESKAYALEFREEEKARAEKTAKPKMTLEGAEKGNFVTRFPPEPNGYMHIGHAKAAFMEREFTDIYSGKIGLYFDDTNPETEKQEYVDAFKNDLKWLGIKFDTEYFASDNIERMYEYATTLLNDGYAYVCFCAPEEVRENRSSGKECKHKKQSKKENAKLWEAMLDKKSTNCILRFNGNIKDTNTAMRDPTLFRIKTEHHYRQGSKYAVWPTYDFNTPIMDSINGVTDALRSKEYELRDELYYKILDLLKLRKPRIRSFARLEIENNITSKRKLKELINGGKLWGYDDPRLVTISGLRRRGIHPKAIREFVLRFGMSKSESVVKMEMLLAENRKIVDYTSKRLFFVENPIKVAVEGIPKEKQKVKIAVHPKNNLGTRQYSLASEFFINASDASTIKKGDKLRLKDAFDIEIERKDKNALSAKYVPTADSNAPRVQWVNQGNYLGCKALMIGDLLDGESFNSKGIVAKEGFVEAYANELEDGEVVQFERTGFFKLDSKKDMSFFSL